MFFWWRARSGASTGLTSPSTARYAMEKGRFYLLDDDHKEFEMVVLEKVLRPAAKPAPQAS